MEDVNMNQSEQPKSAESDTPRTLNQPDELQRAIEEVSKWNLHHPYYATLLSAAKQLQQVTKERDGFINNFPKCGACAEALSCGSSMNAHDADCVYTERDSIKAVLEKCAKVLDSILAEDSVKDHYANGTIFQYSFQTNSEIHRSIIAVLSDPIVQAILKEKE